MEELRFYNRRKFIKKASLASMAIPMLSSFSFLKKNKLKKLTILHTNDMHSHIDPFPINDSKYPGLGGMTRIGSLVDQIRSKEDNVPRGYSDTDDDDTDEEEVKLYFHDVHRMTKAQLEQLLRQCMPRKSRAEARGGKAEQIRNKNLHQRRGR